MSMSNDSLSRRSALAPGGALAGGFAASATPSPAEVNTSEEAAQLSASPDPQPANNGPATPDTAGSSGELHQNAGGSHPSMTTNQGVVIADS